MSNHRVDRYLADLSTKLAARSRHVCVLLGAGASAACGLPTVGELERLVLKGLKESESKAFASQLEHGDLEDGLSRLRAISALLGDGQLIDGLGAEEAKALDASVCAEIVKALAVDGVDDVAMRHMAAWVRRADYLTPLEIFTVNYDLLVERALEREAIPYFDGFVGALEARFNADLVDPHNPRIEERIPRAFARIWKLHGSVHWERNARGEVVRRGGPVEAGRIAAIYPSEAKYEESRRVPFVVLQDRLRRALQEPETLVLVSGYSFGDDHLNDLLFDAAARRPRSEIDVFCHGEIPEALAEKALVTPNIQVLSPGHAILGGRRWPWEPDDGGDQQFDLGDFRNLAQFLAGQMPGYEAVDPSAGDVSANSIPDAPENQGG